MVIKLEGNETMIFECGNCIVTVNADGVDLRENDGTTQGPIIFDASVYAVNALVLNGDLEPIDLTARKAIKLLSTKEKRALR